MSEIPYDLGLFRMCHKIYTEPVIKYMQTKVWSLCTEL